LFGALDKFVGKNAGAYATGDQITIADLAIYQMNTSYGSGAFGISL
jgi:glutathione S-transferase